MTFSVLWTEEAYASIARIIDDANELDELAVAIRRLDSELAHDPGTKGESRPAGQRILFMPPLGALYEIYWRLNQVVIVDIWRFE